ncbi:hypothetical protein LEP1GSC082_1197 [Leptospira kirschneri str. H2]|nr:hypothetical protein LEP1GSC082_1197 [Leptospira kirschneri str. H2]EMK24790.1 hypothetical protein LEP1GSC008_1741 [Leptospira kirschneri serovar Bulgarica str. Nikolaevo]
METHRFEYSIQSMANVLGVSRSGFYQFLKNYHVKFFEILGQLKLERREPLSNSKKRRQSNYRIKSLFCGRRKNEKLFQNLKMTVGELLESLQISRYDFF